MKPFLRIAISLLLTAAFLILFWRSFDVAAARRSLAAASPVLLVVSAAVNLGGYLLRAWRWRYLLQPLRRGVGMYNLTSTTFIDFMVSFLVPFRVGEVVRPVLLSRRERLSASATIATIALERLLDVLTVMGLFLVFVLSARGAALIAPPDAAGALPRATLFLRRGVEVAAAFVAIGLPLAILLVAFPARVVALLGRLDRGGRSPFLGKIAGVVETFATGLRVLRRGRELFACLALSLALWLAIDLSVYLTLVAFGLPLVFSDTFLLLVPLAVGIAVPTPGGVGPYEYLGQISLTDFWGVGAASAAATAVVLHIIALVPTIVIGLLFMWRDGLRLADVRAAGAADPIRETPS